MNLSIQTRRKQELYGKNSIMLSFIMAFIVLIGLYIFCMVRGLTKIPFHYYSALCLIIMYLVIMGLKEKNKINPYILFVLTPLTLLIYDINVSTHYLVELKSETYNLAIYNFTCLIFGFWIVRKIKIGAKERFWNKYTNIKSKQYSKIAYQMMFIGVIPTFWAGVFGISDLLVGNLNAMKDLVGTAPLSSILGLLIYPAIIFALKSKRKNTIIFCGGMLIFSLILNFSKSTVLMMCITVIVAFYEKVVKNKKMRIWIVVLIILSAIFLFLAFDIYNNIRFENDMSEYFQDLDYVGNVSGSWFLPYMYLISPWSNVQYIMETTSTSHTYGLWLLKPFLGYLQLDGMFGDAFTLVPRYVAFNTYSYISVLYIDFGFVGSGICSFILGAFIMWIYKLYCKYFESPIVIAIYALNVYATVMLFFNNHYLQLSYPITILILMFLWTKIFGTKRIRIRG